MSPRLATNSKGKSGKRGCKVGLTWWETLGNWKFFKVVDHFVGSYLLKYSIDPARD
jgi:hypothetical protein